MMRKTNPDAPDIPDYEIRQFQPKRSRYCVCIPVLNEGERIRRQLAKMQPFASSIDILIADGASRDGALDEPLLKESGVRALLTKKGPGKLGAQQRMAFAYAHDQGYAGVITVDGNDKDDTSAIPRFVEALDAGYDFVQGSRFLRGGKAIHTPLGRLLGIRFLHAPWISLLAGFRYTDTTNGFRAHSARLLADPRLALFRSVFNTYELLAYLSAKAPRLGFKVKEIPVTRTYPQGKLPTKIHGLAGSLLLLSILFKLMLGVYDPPR